MQGEKALHFCCMISESVCSSRAKNDALSEALDKSIEPLPCLIIAVLFSYYQEFLLFLRPNA